MSEWDDENIARTNSAPPLAAAVAAGFVLRFVLGLLLTVSDGFGRVIAERRSAALPGAAMLVTLRVGPPQATLYEQTGGAFGWLCVAAGVLLIGMGRRQGRKSQ